MPPSISATNLIVIAILAVILFFAVRSSIRHLHGAGGCCGGGTYKAHPKKLEPVAQTKTFPVDGMTCQHCVNRVMDAVNSIDGVSGVVHLKKGIVTVSMEHPVEDAIICQAIEKAGYTVPRTKN